MVTARFKSNRNLGKCLFLTPPLNQRAEFGKQRRRIVRPGRRFGMILHAKNRLGLVAQALDGLIVQIDAVYRDAGRQRFRVHGKTMILRRDFDFAGFQVLHRLVCAAMTEFQFKSFPAERLSENLMA
jgi:hypothetical protein